jgi:hypothetical protein
MVERIEYLSKNGIKGNGLDIAITTIFMEDKSFPI